MLAVVGHPRLRDDGGRSADPSALLRTLQARGKDALADIGGDFALAAWDGQRRRGLMAVDRIGVHQLVYGRANGALAFASSLDMVGGYPGVRRDLSAQGLFDYLFYHVSPGPRTIFTDLCRVPPGHCIEFGAGAAGEPRAYWSMQFNEQPGQPQDALKQEFVSLMQGAVQDAAGGDASGAFLSGGTDSSTVSGMLARAGKGPARTFSIGFDVAGYDEMEYARIAARHFGCEHHEYYVTPQDVVDAVPKIAASYDQPFGNASAVPTYYCAKLAREHGVTRLLAGDGGDELFGGNERYAKHHLLGLYQRVPEALKRFLIEPMALSMPGTERIAPLRKLRSYVEQARPPMPQRYASYNLLMYLGQANVFTPEFLASVDPEHPQKLLAEAHAPYAGASLINQMLGIDLRFILADGDLPKVTHMCELAGVDVAFPMLDERVIEFSQRLAADLKLRGTTLRWFFKQALSDFLPPAVITKQKHGFGLPVGEWLIGHKPLFDLAADSIGTLRQRGIVQPRFIDELLATRLREHPAYFGTMVWVLMMLGLWLESRKL
jgi:asparagine synthase (glutamine-hydrolysing)